MNNKSTMSVKDEILNLLKESAKRAAKEIKEIRAFQRETTKKARKEVEEIRTIQKETAQQMKETDRQIQKIGGRFNERWGTFVESLVEGNLVRILRGRGIDITQTHSRSEAEWTKPDGSIQKQEFDIIVANETEVVVVEVKTTLSLKDVTVFLKTLQNFKKYFRRYKTETVYGAMAYLRSGNKAHFFCGRRRSVCHPSHR